MRVTTDKIKKIYFCTEMPDKTTTRINFANCKKNTDSARVDRCFETNRMAG